MLYDQDKEKIKQLVLKALEDFSDLQLNLKSEHCREVIAVRIASDVINSQNEQPLAPEEIEKN